MPASIGAVNLRVNVKVFTWREVSISASKYYFTLNNVNNYVRMCVV